jgi:hypothetical protein
MLRNGWRNARVVHACDGEEGCPRRWDGETAERLDRDFAALGIEHLSLRHPDL